MKSAIYPAKSPTGFLSGEKPEAPEHRSRRALKEIAEEHQRRLSPLIRAKDEADKVYSNGYFENNYPDADRTLKHLLHEKVMAAWAGANSMEKEEEEHHEPRGLGGASITINLG